MLELIGVVASVGIGDSLNPATILAALYLAGRDRPRAHVLAFTLAVFVVYLAGGLAIVLGPGQLALAAIPHPSPQARHIIEIAIGSGMLSAAALLWLRRRRLSEQRWSTASTRMRSSAILGATLTIVELPTAFPYLAAIAAIVDSGFSPTRQVLLLGLFNVCFVLPLIAIIAVLILAPNRAQRILGATRERLERRWPMLTAGIALLAGVAVLALGISGLIGGTDRPVD
jgi:cytochrome c biogenesis protein CcdA